MNGHDAASDLPVPRPSRPEGVTRASGPRRARNEGGFALILVLIALVGLTTLGVGGWLLSDSGYKASRAHRTSTQAYYLANTGLERFLGTHQGPMPASRTFTFSDGTALVTTSRLRILNPLQSVWLVHSEGRHPLPKGGTATRTVGTIAILDADSFNFPSAFSSATGITKNGAAGTITGIDQSDSGDCPEAGAKDTNGVMTPDSAFYTQSGGAQLVPDGSPKDTAVAPSAEAVLDSTGIDWQSMVNGETLEFDYRVPPDDWPNYDSIPESEWPVVYVDNKDSEYTVGPSHDGRGTLIVRGDLKMDGDFDWKGPVLVGGKLTTDGFQTVEGGITSGFNLQLGEDVGQSSIGNGSKSIQFHNCYNHAAMKHTARLVEDRGTFFETWTG